MLEKIRGVFERRGVPFELYVKVGGFRGVSVSHTFTDHEVEYISSEMLDFSGPNLADYATKHIEHPIASVSLVLRLEQAMQKKPGGKIKR